MRLRPACCRAIALALVSLCLAGCQRESPYLQGYVEGEYVYIASPRAGQLDKLNVQRGQQVEAGAPLFSLDPEPEKAERAAAEERVEQARATLEDVKKGMRPSEIRSLEAQIARGTASVQFWEAEVQRLEKAFLSRAVAKEELDRGHSTLEQERQSVARLQQDLVTGQLGSREDQIAASAAQLKMQEAALAQADWNLQQKSQVAPSAGLIFDTLYREGEWVASERPVVILLPPGNIRVRAFVPQPRLGGAQLGDLLEVKVDGLAAPIQGRVTYISPKAEYTPPVIYSRETRDKLVYMIELQFDPEIAAQLHPGQPVEVALGHAK